MKTTLGIICLAALLALTGCSKPEMDRQPTRSGPPKVPSVALPGSGSSGGADPSGIGRVKQASYEFDLPDLNWRDTTGDEVLDSEGEPIAEPADTVLKLAYSRSSGDRLAVYRVNSFTTYSEIDSEPIRAQFKQMLKDQGFKETSFSLIESVGGEKALLIQASNKNKATANLLMAHEGKGYMIVVVQEASKNPANTIKSLIETWAWV